LQSLGSDRVSKVVFCPSTQHNQPSPAISLSRLHKQYTNRFSQSDQIWGPASEEQTPHSIPFHPTHTIHQAEPDLNGMVRSSTIPCIIHSIALVIGTVGTYIQTAGPITKTKLPTSRLLSFIREGCYVFIGTNVPYLPHRSNHFCTVPYIYSTQ
jgi:hypothetical protein